MTPTATATTTEHAATFADAYCDIHADANKHAYRDCNRYNASTQQPMTSYLNNNVFTGSAYGPTLPAV